MKKETTSDTPATVTPRKQSKFGCLLRLALVVLGLLVTSAILLLLAYNHNLYRGTDQDGPLIILGGTLFDGTGKAPYPNSKIVVTEGRVVCMGGSCESPAAAKVVDATGLSIIPGLVDLHVHFGAPSREDQDRPMPLLLWDYFRQRPALRRACLEAGVTTIRSVGDAWPEILRTKRQIESSALAGPRIFVVGPIFTAPGGHPVSTHYKGNPWLIERATRQVDHPDQATLEVQKLAEEGVDGIKAVYGSKPRLPLKVLRAVVESAHKQGLWVAVHAGTPEEVRDAAQAGADTIEHGINRKGPLEPPLVKVLKERRVTYVPTLAVFAAYLDSDSPRVRSAMENRFKRAMNNLLAANNGGVAIGCGSDTHGPDMSFGESVHRELELMVEAGLSPTAALLSATRNAATALNVAEDLGSIQVGKIADLVVVNGEPWNEISDVRKIKVVIQDGRVVVDRGWRLD